MNNQKKIRVFIIDDSPFFRAFLIESFARDASIEIVGYAQDPVEASKKIVQCLPDVVTCDIEMPKMNGIQFAKQLMAKYPLPLIIISIVSCAAVDALKAGAVDFMAKKKFESEVERETFIQILIDKIHIAAQANVHQKTKQGLLHGIRMQADFQTKIQLIAIGASTGGTEAIFQLLKDLPPEVPGIVIVQHIPAGFSRMFAERLDKFTFFKVKEAVSGDVIWSGQVLIAPGDMQMRVIKEDGRYKVLCTSEDKVNGHCPSADVLFYSVAKVAGKDAMGAILTGMGSDGACGLLSMRQAGARTVGQDEASSVVYGMPQEAYKLGAVEKQTSLQNMAKVMYRMLQG